MVSILYFSKEDQSAVHLQLNDLVSSLQTGQEVQVVGGSRGPAGQLISRYGLNCLTKFWASLFRKNLAGSWNRTLVTT